jgi:hypothetical protein
MECVIPGISGMFHGNYGDNARESVPTDANFFLDAPQLRDPRARARDIRREGWRKGGGTECGA